MHTIGLQSLNGRLSKLICGIGDIHANNLARINQSLGMLFEAKDR